MMRRALLRQAQSSSISRGTLRPTTSFLQSPARWTGQTPRRRITSAWYSSSSESNNSGAAESSASGQASSEQTDAQKQSGEEDPVKKELEAKNREVIDLKDKYLRSVADFRNLQERTRREVESARQFAIQRFAKDLIDSVDNLDRALTTVPPEKLVPKDTTDDPQTTTGGATRDLINLYDGLKMTETILMQTLKKHGLERFDPSENKERFDPNMHEATFQAPVQGLKDGTVFHTQQKGFVLNGRVLRAAKVGLVKNPPASNASPSSSSPPPPPSDAPSQSELPHSPS